MEESWKELAASSVRSRPPGPTRQLAADAPCLSLYALLRAIATRIRRVQLARPRPRPPSPPHHPTSARPLAPRHPAAPRRPARRPRAPLAHHGLAVHRREQRRARRQPRPRSPPLDPEVRPLSRSLSSSARVELIVHISARRVIDAFKRVDRRHYVNHLSDAYVDAPSYLRSVPRWLLTSSAARHAALLRDADSEVLRPQPRRDDQCAAHARQVSRAARPAPSKLAPLGDTLGGWRRRA